MKRKFSLGPLYPTPTRQKLTKTGMFLLILKIERKDLESLQVIVNGGSCVVCRRAACTGIVLIA